MGVVGIMVIFIMFLKNSLMSITYIIAQKILSDAIHSIACKYVVEVTVV